MSGTEPTSPAAVARGIAARARALAGEILAMQQDAHASGSGLPDHAMYRCDEAAADLRNAADDMLETAADLDRVAAAAAPGTCTIPWGVCPDHGNYLIGTGGRCWCQRPGCGRRWDYDREGLPCTEPARWRVTDQAGVSALMCNGHAMDARERLEGAVITAIGKDGGDE